MWNIMFHWVRHTKDQGKQDKTLFLYQFFSSVRSYLLYNWLTGHHSLLTRPWPILYLAQSHSVTTVSLNHLNIINANQDSSGQLAQCKQITPQKKLTNNAVGLKFQGKHENICRHKSPYDGAYPIYLHIPNWRWKYENNENLIKNIQMLFEGLLRDLLLNLWLLGAFFKLIHPIKFERKTREWWMCVESQGEQINTEQRNNRAPLELEWEEIETILETILWSPLL